MTQPDGEPPVDPPADPPVDPPPPEDPPAEDPPIETGNDESQRGYFGDPVDVTPRENYSVTGVTAGAPTPETTTATTTSMGDGIFQVLLPELYARLSRLERNQQRLERTMADNQARVDAAVTAINEAVGNVETEVAALKAAVAAGQTDLDFSGLESAVGRLNASTDTVESGETPASPVEPTA